MANADNTVPKEGDDKCRDPWAEPIVDPDEPQKPPKKALPPEPPRPKPDNHQFLAKAPGPLVTPTATSGGIDWTDRHGWLPAMDGKVSRLESASGTIRIQDAISIVLGVPIGEKSISDILNKTVNYHHDTSTRKEREPVYENGRIIGTNIHTVGCRENARLKLVACIEETNEGFVGKVKHAVETLNTKKGLNITPNHPLTVKQQHEIRNCLNDLVTQYGDTLHFDPKREYPAWQFGSIGHYFEAAPTYQPRTVPRPETDVAPATAAAGEKPAAQVTQVSKEQQAIAEAIARDAGLSWF